MPEIETKPREADAREGEEWFLRLPAKKQQELQASWTRSEKRSEDWHFRDRARLRRSIVESGLLMAAILLLVDGLGMNLGRLLFVVVGGAVIGSGAGAALHFARAERFQCAIYGAIAFVVAQGVLVEMLSFATLIGGVFAAKLFAGYGMVRESRVFDD